MESWFTHASQNRFLFLNDLLLAPLFIFAAYFLAKKYASSKKSPVYKKYFVLALMVRFASAIVMALVYQYYYDGGGDSHTYFTYVQRIRGVFHEDISAYLDLAFKQHHNTFYAIRYLGSGAEFYFNQSASIVIKLALYLSYPLLNTYILISFVFTIICFYGCWKIFLLFYEIYPQLEKQLAIACLFLPSVCFWGTGILKDPICLGALGALTYHIYKLFFEKTKIIQRLILIAVCLTILVAVKVYIILSFLPAYSIWIIFRYKNNIKNSLVKSLMNPVLFIVSLLVGVVIFIKIAAVSERYAFDNLVRTAKDTQNWLYLSSQYSKGSGYSLGNVDYTPLGVLKVFPKAVNVAIFRPYLWEAKKPILIPAALEGLVSLFFTIRLLYKAGFMRFIKLVLTNPEVQFCLVFSLLFAFSVGFTSYNFGSLVRYKIPFMPFYFIALIILADKEKEVELKPDTLPVKPIAENPALAHV